jgi:hypothetical protein
MERKIFIGVLAASCVALAVGIFGPAELSDAPRDVEQKLPWDIQQVDGTTQVFGLKLGESTMEDGLQNFKASAEVSLFVSEDDHHVVEAFFNDVNIMGLGAKVVLAADLEQDEMRAMYKRGLRIAKLGSGTRKVTLSEDDLLLVRQATIANITYLPKIHLEDDLVQKRFGEPSQRIKEKEGDAVHWLYPSLGLDVTLSEEEKDVLQYLPPAEFSKLLIPLQRDGDTL